MPTPTGSVSSPPAPPAASRGVVWGLLLVLAFIWGASFILIKKGLVVFSADEVGGLRIGIASLALLPFAVGQLRLLGADRWKYLLLSGLLGNLFPAFLFALAETGLASAVAGILNSLTGLFTLLIGGIFFGIAITRRHVAGIVLGMVGTVVLMWPGVQAGSSNVLYGLYIVLATICYGGSVNIIKNRLQSITPLAVSSLSLLLVGPLAIGYLLSTPILTKVRYTPGAWEALGYISVLAVFGTAVALVLFNKLVQLSSALFSSSVTYLIPVVALGWGILDGESIHLLHVLGMATILSGIFLISRSR